MSHQPMPSTVPATPLSVRDGHGVVNSGHDARRAEQSTTLFSQASAVTIQDSEFSTSTGSQYHSVGAVNVTTVIQQGPPLKSSNDSLKDRHGPSSNPSRAYYVIKCQSCPRGSGLSPSSQPTPLTSSSLGEESFFGGAPEIPTPAQLTSRYWRMKMEEMEIRGEMMKAREQRQNSREAELERRWRELVTRTQHLVKKEAQLSSLEVDLLSREHTIENSIQDLRQREIELELKLAAFERVADVGTVRSNTGALPPESLLFSHPGILQPILIEDSMRSSTPLSYLSASYHSARSAEAQSLHLPPVPQTPFNVADSERTSFLAGERTVFDSAGSLPDHGNDGMPPAYTQHADEGDFSSQYEPPVRTATDYSDSLPETSRRVSELCGALSPRMTAQLDSPTAPNHPTTVEHQSSRIESRDVDGQANQRLSGTSGISEGSNTHVQSSLFRCFKRSTKPEKRRPHETKRAPVEPKRMDDSWEDIG